MYPAREHRHLPAQLPAHHRRQEPADGDGDLSGLRAGAQRHARAGDAGRHLHRQRRSRHGRIDPLAAGRLHRGRAQHHDQRRPPGRDLGRGGVHRGRLADQLRHLRRLGPDRAAAERRRERQQRGLPLGQRPDPDRRLRVRDREHVGQRLLRVHRAPAGLVSQRLMPGGEADRDRRRLVVGHLHRFVGPFDRHAGRAPGRRVQRLALRPDHAPAGRPAQLHRAQPDRRRGRRGGAVLRRHRRAVQHDRQRDRAAGGLQRQRRRLGRLEHDLRQRLQRRDRAEQRAHLPGHHRGPAGQRGQAVHRPDAGGRRAHLEQRPVGLAHQQRPAAGVLVHRQRLHHDDLRRHRQGDGRVAGLGSAGLQHAADLPDRLEPIAGRLGQRQPDRCDDHLPQRRQRALRRRQHRLAAEDRRHHLGSVPGPDLHRRLRADPGHRPPELDGRR